MATYNRTSSGGGTVGHPSNAANAYVITSPVYDAADNTNLAQGDIVELVDVPADTLIIGGCVEVLEAAGNSNVSMDLGFTGGDVDCFIDGSALAAGFQPFLNAAIGASGSNPKMVTSADTIDALIISSSGTETALRFRIHVVMVDVSKNPVESATVTTGT
jgi:hypothetical protein